MSMKKRMLAVRKTPAEAYNISFEPHYAPDFETAKQMIQEAEKNGEPFETLSLPMQDEDAYFAFLIWLKENGNVLPVGIYDYRTTEQFVDIRNRSRAVGVNFLD